MVWKATVEQLSIVQEFAAEDEPEVCGAPRRLRTQGALCSRHRQLWCDARGVLPCLADILGTMTLKGRYTCVLLKLAAYLWVMSRWAAVPCCEHWQCVAFSETVTELPHTFGPLC